MAYYRDIFTGELKERPDSPGRQIIYRETLKYGMKPGIRRKRAWHRRVNRNMSIPPEQATPERIEQENADAARHGTGAYYTCDGLCHTEGRDIENREMRRRGYANFDAGYGDWAGR